MGKIYDLEYSKKRINEDDDIEYYINDFDEWMTQEQIAEDKYWKEDYANEIDNQDEPDY